MTRRSGDGDRSRKGAGGGVGMATTSQQKMETHLAGVPGRGTQTGW